MWGSRHSLFHLALDSLRPGPLCMLQSLARVDRGEGPATLMTTVSADCSPVGALCIFLLIISKTLSSRATSGPEAQRGKPLTQGPTAVWGHRCPPGSLLPKPRPSPQQACFSSTTRASQAAQATLRAPLPLCGPCLTKPYHPRASGSDHTEGSRGLRGCPQSQSENTTFPLQKYISESGNNLLSVLEGALWRPVLSSPLAPHRVGPSLTEAPAG